MSQPPQLPPGDGWAQPPVPAGYPPPPPTAPPYDRPTYNGPAYSEPSYAPPPQFAPAYGWPTPSPAADLAPTPGVIALTVAWRGLVSITGFTGLILAHDAVGGSSWNLAYLSQLGALIVGLYFAVLAALPLVAKGRVDEPDPFVRMSVLALVLITFGVYNFMMDGGTSESWSLFEHILVPLAVLADWLIAGRNQERVRAWHAVALPIVPVLYLLFAVQKGKSQGEPLYDVLDTSDSGFAPFVATTLIAVIGLGFVLMAIGRFRRSLRVGSAPRP